MSGVGRRCAGVGLSLVVTVGVAMTAEATPELRQIAACVDNDAPTQTRLARGYSLDWSERPSDGDLGFFQPLEPTAKGNFFAYRKPSADGTWTIRLDAGRARFSQVTTRPASATEPSCLEKSETDFIAVEPIFGRARGSLIASTSFKPPGGRVRIRRPRACSTEAAGGAVVVTFRTAGERPQRVSSNTICNAWSKPTRTRIGPVLLTAVGVEADADEILVGEDNAVLEVDATVNKKAVGKNRRLRLRWEARQDGRVIGRGRFTASRTYIRGENIFEGTDDFINICLDPNGSAGPVRSRNGRLFCHVSAYDKLAWRMK